MPRSTRNTEHVNSISLEELKAVLGPNFEEAVKTGIAEYFAQAGRMFAEALIAGEVDSLCGPKHSRKKDGAGVRWGSQPGTITLNGVKEPIQKPRVRSADGKHEIDLETYALCSRKDALSADVIAKIGSGVSARQYEKTIRKELRHHGLSRSTVSRRVVRATQASLEAFLSRRWDKHNFVALMIDGVHIGSTHVVAAVGIDKSGYKHVLGWQVGSTENATVCRDLLRKLADAGLDQNGDYLFVLDGSKALKLAVQQRFGDNSVIQRCQEHKIRDIEDYLPVRLRKRFRVLLQAAYNQPGYVQASNQLQRIRTKLLSISEPAANSLTEGLEETLTLHKLGITGGVRQSLRTTNIVESSFSRLRANTRNVTNWAELQQIERWLAFGLLKVERGYRRLDGYRQLAKLQRKVRTALQST